MWENVHGKRMMTEASHNDQMLVIIKKQLIYGCYCLENIINRRKLDVIEVPNQINQIYLFLVAYLSFIIYLFLYLQLSFTTSNHLQFSLTISVIYNFLYIF